MRSDAVVFIARRKASFRACILLVVAHLAVLCPAVVLKYATWDGADTLPVTHRLVAEFEDAHPGVRVEVEQVPSYDFFMRKLLVRYAAAAAPDVVQMDSNSLLKFSSRGILLPLEERLARSGDDAGRYYPTALNAVQHDGHLWVLPRTMNPTGLLFYNKRRFREAGIPYPDGTWTWDLRPRPHLREKDFEWVLERLTKRDVGGRNLSYAYSTGWQDLLTESLLLSRGVWLADSIERPTRVRTADPEVVEVFEVADRWLNRRRLMPTATEMATVLQSSVGQEFVKGRIAIYQTGPWEIQRLRRDLAGKFDWDVTLFPAFAGRSPVRPGIVAGVALVSQTRYPKEAWAFARWMAGERSQVALARAGLGQPAYRDLAIRPGVWKRADGEPPARLELTDQAAATMRCIVLPDYFRTAMDAIWMQMDNVWNGRGEPSAAMREAQSTGQVRLERALQRQGDRPFPSLAGGALAVLAVAGLAVWVYLPDLRNRGGRISSRENRTAYLLLSPWLLGLLGLTLGPMLYSAMMSLADWDMIRPPRWVGVENYRSALLEDPAFWNSLRVTSVYTLFAVPLGIVGALALALLLNQPVCGVKLFRSLYYIPTLASGVAAALVWRRLFNAEGGLINSLIYGPSGDRDLLGLGSFLSHLAGTPGQPVNWLGSEATALPAMILMSMWGIGGGMVILLAGLQGIPTYYYEAATLDGAGVLGRFRNVTLPLLTPTLFFTLITGIIGSFQVFTQAYVMTRGGPNEATNFYMLHLYLLAFENLSTGYASALAWILFLIVMVLTLVQVGAARRWVYYEAEAR